jgi:hypothetical protein
VLLHNVLQRPIGIELIFRTGKAFRLIVQPEIHHRIAEALDRAHLWFCQTVHPVEFVTSTGLTQKWLNHQLSNFEYLIALNILGGRSFLDSSNYPLFPWILLNFKDIGPTIRRAYSAGHLSTAEVHRVLLTRSLIPDCRSVRLQARRSPGEDQPRSPDFGRELHLSRHFIKQHNYEPLVNPTAAIHAGSSLDRRRQIRNPGPPFSIDVARRSADLFGAGLLETRSGTVLLPGGVR